MAPKILLVNQPIYDFAAYDFWLKPLGLLTVAGKLRNYAQMFLFDYLDRLHPDAETLPGSWSRGTFPAKIIKKPKVFTDIPRHFHRFGLKRELFHRQLEKQAPLDFVMIQTVMTYWYPGVKEVIQDIKKISPAAKIILGGPYATLCPTHAEKLGPDLVINGPNLNPLWKLLDIAPPRPQPPLWEAYEKLNVGAMTLTSGCPYNCTYCCVSKIHPAFTHRPLAECIADLEFLLARRVKEIAFYDDAILYQPQKLLIPFLEYIIAKNIKTNFHSPNGLAARYIKPQIADLMVKAGFKTFYLGFESNSEKWQKQTGSKIFAKELADAVTNLKNAGAQPNNITAYQILGHPSAKTQQLEESMKFANSLNIKIMLADFSPIPQTPDGQKCKKWISLENPIEHNKTAFPITLLGNKEVNRLKNLCRTLNRSLAK